MESERRTSSIRNSTGLRLAAGACLIALLAGIGVLVFHHPSRPDPFADDTVHEVTADCASALGCWITIGEADHPGWTGQSGDPMPDAWWGKQVAGTLTINHNWGPDPGVVSYVEPGQATFTADDVTVPVWGGKPDGKHFFPA